MVLLETVDFKINPVRFWIYYLYIDVLNIQMILLINLKVTIND
jgi:hypothetical protein